jgi:putative acetyltransferase
MNITIERVIQATPDVHDLIGELNDVLGAAYEAHQRHGLSTEQLFEPNVRFFLARLENLAAAARCSTTTPRSSACIPGQPHAASDLAKGLLRRIEDEARAAGAPLLCLETGIHQQEAIGLLRDHGVSATWSIRLLRSDASPQDRIAPLYQKVLDQVGGC